MRVEPDLVSYIVGLANATRTARDVRLPVSTRGAQALHRAARARAVVQGREYVVPEDVRALLIPALSHRMAVRGGDGAAEALLLELASTVAIPE